MNNVVKTFTHKYILNKLKIINSENEDIDIRGSETLFYERQNITMKKY